MTISLCPCGSSKDYAKCCGVWHHNEAPAPDAATLMRSRYSAFVLDELDYLLKTWHPDTRPESLEPNPGDIKWLGLDVRKHVVLDDSHASVEFVARFRQAGRATRLHEISRFEKIDGRWYYQDGSFPA